MSESPPSSQLTVRYNPIRRISRACDSCRRRKTRCSGHRPTCQSCIVQNFLCRYSTDPPYPYRRPTRKSAAHVCDDYRRERASARHQDSDHAERLARIEEQLFGIRQDVPQYGYPRSASAAGSVGVHETDAGTDAVEDLIPVIEEPFGAVCAVGTPTSTGELTAPQARLSKAPGAPEPLALPELPFATAQNVLGHYFAFCHEQPFSFFNHEALLKKHLNGAIPRALMLAILSNGLCFAVGDGVPTEPRRLARQFASESWLLVSQPPTTDAAVDGLARLQAVVLLAIFSFAGPLRPILSPCSNVLLMLTCLPDDRTWHWLAWIKVSTAVRLAQDLRLMDSRSHGDLSGVAQEERQRTFWSLYALDRLMCCGRWRFASIPDHSCGLPLPPGNVALSQDQTERPPKLDQLFDYRSAIDLGELAPAAQLVAVISLLTRSTIVMFQTMNGAEAPWNPRSDYMAIRAHLGRIHSGARFDQPLGEVVREHHPRFASSGPHTDVALVVMARLVYYACQGLLNHPFLLRRQIELAAVPRPHRFLSSAFRDGLEAARSTLKALTQALELGCIVTHQFSGFCILLAGTYYAIHTAHAQDEATRAESRDAFGKLLNHLLFLSQYSEVAKHMMALLEEIPSHIAKYPTVLQDGDTPGDDGLADNDILWSLVDYSSMLDGIEGSP